MEQVDKRAKNFETFVKSHRAHWQEMKDKRDTIVDEIRNAEEELKAMLEAKPSKDQAEQGEDAKIQDDAEQQQEGSQSAAQQLQEANWSRLEPRPAYSVLSRPFSALSVPTNNALMLNVYTKWLNTYSNRLDP